MRRAARPYAAALPAPASLDVADVASPSASTCPRGCSSPSSARLHLLLAYLCCPPTRLILRGAGSERREEAAKTLDVDVAASAGEIKKAHRKLMLELHPDRFIGDDDAAEAAAAAEARMLRVQDAYEQLGGGMGGAHGSWYASIGGKARVDFSGPLTKEQLGPLGKARVGQEMDVTLGGWRAGVYPMQPDITREFVTRNTMRSVKTDA